MAILRFYRKPALNPGAHQVVLTKLQNVLPEYAINELVTELCFNVDVLKEVSLSSEDQKKLLWILTIPFETENICKETFLRKNGSAGEALLIEIGPRLNFSTAWSTNAVSMCHSAGLHQIHRIECSKRFLIQVKNKDGEDVALATDEAKKLTSVLHDRMTECEYQTPLDSFNIDVKPEPVYVVNVMEEGRKALEKANNDLGLAFDDWDLDYYTTMFKEKIKRNPTSVECFDLAQSNSEHSRHWFFKGRMVIDDIEHEDSLFTMVMNTQENSNDNNVIKFSDNSSAIKGFDVKLICPTDPLCSSVFTEKRLLRHIIFTAETHNFPTGVAPFSGATTGTGGRIRDVQAAGRGAHVVAGTAGYCFGNLHIPDYDLPWEDKSFIYPGNFASPLEVAIEASNGASDYGNKFGEPVLAGFARSFGMNITETERREWVKPIMFSGGIGSLEHQHIAKLSPKSEMEVVKIGGPVYRIGVGGGAASSVQVQGDNAAELDFGAVQRGDAEMEQKLNRVIRGCIEMGDNNPICSIHDQGAGGNGNVLKEICEPAGAIIRVNDFQLADPTINTLELWGAEYQESNAVLIKSKDKDNLQKLCNREKCPVSFVGNITGDGIIRLEEECTENGKGDVVETSVKRKKGCSYPVDLDLEWVLGTMPRKEFKLYKVKRTLSPLNLPDVTVKEALDRVLRLPSVASKRYLTNKVDRSVTGLIAQQQCVGPLHTPLGDVAVTALSHFDIVGSATSIGEQPIKGLVDSGCGARMSVAESLTNLVFASVTSLKDVKCSGNWMWPAKLPGEGAALFETCEAMCKVMKELGIAIDGGKDSLSMAARVGSETVKAPGTIVISAYVGCPDITATITPDLKCINGKGALIWVDISGGHHRLGGTALAQCYNQLGNVSPDLDEPQLLVKAFNVTQQLIKDRLLTAGHDISDGGLITCILEMAFAGNCGMDINFNTSKNSVSVTELLFSEELGLIIEAQEENVDSVIKSYKSQNVPCHIIGSSQGQGQSAKVCVSVDDKKVLEEKTTELRRIWEETSFRLERLQSNPQCVEEEETNFGNRTAPLYKMSFDPSVMPAILKNLSNKPKVGIIREEGSNGDREMISSFYMAGFEVWDVNMQDLCTAKVTLDHFRGVVFVGGFSYADVCGSAKGWAAAVLFNQTVRAQFDAFRARHDTFSLGVCNGCQLMGLLGWIAPADIQDQDGDCASAQQGVFLTHNNSERFESRFVSVQIQSSPAIMLKGMDCSTLGVWVAHGEGNMKFLNDEILQNVLKNNLAPIRYVDDIGDVTTQYPLNPNGSPNGIAALCSRDGRHLAMMPHPERCTLVWQWPWMPNEWRKTLKVSPWLRMFQNACVWCLENQS